MRQNQHITEERESTEGQRRAMKSKINNKGLSLVELIVVIAIMAILVGVIAPTFVRYVERAKQVKVEQEASAFIKAAEIAYVEVYVEGNEPREDSVKNKTVGSSPYYKNGTKYGNLTNWTVHNGVVAGASNASFAEKFFSILGISIGEAWQNGSSSIPISTQQPKLNPSGSMTEECVFQVFYDKNGNMVVEYSRNGYFIRMDNSLLVESVKIRNSSEKHFTSWQ